MASQCSKRQQTSFDSFWDPSRLRIRGEAEEPQVCVVSEVSPKSSPSFFRFKARQRKVGTSQHRQEMRMPNQAQEPVTTVTCSDLLLCNSQDRGQILFPSSRENMKVPYELTVRRKLSKTAYSLEDASFS